MRKLPSRRGSLMKPFQPTVVRGFSKYTRITSSRSSFSSSDSARSRRAYSSACSLSWMEHGPTTTSRRGSSPCTMAATCRRLCSTKRCTASPTGSSYCSRAGEMSGRTSRMRTSSTRVASGVSSLGSMYCVLSVMSCPGCVAGRIIGSVAACAPQPGLAAVRPALRPRTKRYRPRTISSAASASIAVSTKATTGFPAPARRWNLASMRSRAISMQS